MIIDQTSIKEVKNNKSTIVEAIGTKLQKCTYYAISKDIVCSYVMDAIIAYK